MLTTAEVAARLSAARGEPITEHTIRQQCAAGKLPGARKFGMVWAVPDCFADPAAYRAALEAADGRRGSAPTRGSKKILEKVSPTPLTP